VILKDERLPQTWDVWQMERQKTSENSYYITKQIYGSLAKEKGYTNKETAPAFQSASLFT